MVRPESPGAHRHLPKSNSLSDGRPPKSNLEERLRAKVAAAELSKSSKPLPIPVTEHPLSPTSTPLPASPAISPTVSPTAHVDTPLNLASDVPPRVQSPQSFSALSAEQNIPSKHATCRSKSDEVNDGGADISVALSSPSAVEDDAHLELLSKDIDRNAQLEPTLLEIDPTDADVESLQKRLKLVEQRFTGML
jgi:hypothetical protein